MDLTEDQKEHHILMKELAVNLNDTPLVLIGGTALYLCYGLDRFSVDIDLDTSKKINLESRIKNNLPHKIKLNNLRHIKDTPVNSKYNLNYINSCGNENNLVIEMKIKENTEIPFTIIDDIKVAKINYLIKAKIECLEERTKSRDLYDLSFLTEKFKKEFTHDDIKKLTQFIKKNDLLNKYMEDWGEDPLLSKFDITDKIIQLTKNIEQIKDFQFNNSLKRAEKNLERKNDKISLERDKIQNEIN
ncbi:nucleotidyl transferase AbiEii/AbiGii toxin family protein [Gilliamella sp. BG6]|uniref:nucleotidyl transferase AbiEii/AbiGii toxin family protein n=1 Tax=unclassified Gilliamella TaxID=2685620 RepID=UPI003987FD06